MSPSWVQMFKFGMGPLQLRAEKGQSSDAQRLTRSIDESSPQLYAVLQKQIPHSGLFVGILVPPSLIPILDC